MWQGCVGVLGARRSVPSPTGWCRKTCCSGSLPLNESPTIESSLLCLRHADAMVVPRGWTLDDRRENSPRLFNPRTLPGDQTSAPKPVSKHKRPSAHGPGGRNPNRCRSTAPVRSSGPSLRRRSPNPNRGSRRSTRTTISAVCSRSRARCWPGHSVARTGRSTDRCGSPNRWWCRPRRPPCSPTSPT